jgi:MoaA/NifB/PqqE/SkfB family radical SAM enzyme
LSKENLKNIIENIPSGFIRFIKLSGGEPFCFEHFVFLADLLKEKKISFGVTTNGMFDFQHNFFLLKNKCFNFLTFSLDGITEKEVKTFRKKLDCRKVFSNIKQIKKYYPEKKIAVNLILNKNNHHNIEQIIHFFFSEILIDKLNITQLKVTNDKIRNYKCSDMDIVKVIRKIKFLKKEYLEKYSKTIDIDLSFDCNKNFSILDKNLIDDETNLDYRCLAGRTSGFITSEGILIPCEKVLESQKSAAYIDSKYSLMNNKFWDIWDSELFHLVYKNDIDFRRGKVKTVSNCDDCEYRKNRCGWCIFDE